MLVFLLLLGNFVLVSVVVKQPATYNYTLGLKESWVAQSVTVE